MRENPHKGTVREQINRHYQALSHIVGFEVKPYSNLNRNANSLRSVTRMLRKEKRYDEAIELGKLWISQQPKSAYAHYKLTESYMAAGLFYEAQSQNVIGVDLAKANSDPNLPHYIKQKSTIDNELTRETVK